MESIADLVPVAIVIGYLFLKFAGRKTRAAAPSAERPKPRSATRGAAGPTPFEQLLARLEEANMSPRPPEPPPVTPPSRTVVPAVQREFSRGETARIARAESAMAAESRLAVADYEARAAASTAFRPLDDGRGYADETAGYDHDRHGFGLQNPLSEPTFEAAPRTDRRVANANRQGYDPHGLRPALPAPAPTPGQSVADRLKSPEALREAFVLQTILTRRPAPRRPR